MSDRRVDLRAAITAELRTRGPSLTYAIANSLRIPWGDGPAAYPGAKTPAVRRELQRMEREGLVARLPPRSGIHILWGLTSS